MNKVINKISWFTFAALSILIGLYPAIYFFIDRRFGLLSTKNEELLADQIWNVAFYGHIILGGVALLIGWSQFSSRLRKQKIKLHQLIGKIYVVCALISAVTGIYIAQFATGGISNIIGFSLSGIVWFCTTLAAYRSILKGKIELHQNYMIYSYAVCFSAVTLRIWLSILVPTMGSFHAAYQIVGWLSWVPNLFIAYFIIQSRAKRSQLS